MKFTHQSSSELSMHITSKTLKNLNSEIEKLEEELNKIFSEREILSDPSSILKLLDKFDDDRLVGFGKKIIYQEAPDTLPPDIFKSMKRDIAKRILSERKEKWWTIPTLYTEIDTLREKYTNENDEEKLNLLDEFNNYAMSIQKKYENA